ncbi:conserved hypothetical protein [Desulfamplus magnetovallimortis]|uniref:PIN domain-containing protein n=1 Tax=Desulfamplus magnetovallimortis TaxID=1246637 RepID=A0A1W1HHS0_9BACT|nr:putative toxin-antitoxin system toxin component, PIN family [Desulfamplus magnetovallimortis]SLM32051.1 conserved hypothetical protein [Desulfamplus magnetovallimortis]
MFYRVVIDTNILVSSIISPNGRPAMIMTLIFEGKLILISSDAIIDEARRVFFYPHIQKILNNKTQGKVDIDRYFSQFIDDLMNVATIVKGDTELHVIEDDPSDDMFLVCAKEGETDIIISGDKHLLNLNIFEDIPIITVAEFFDDYLE